MRYRLAAPWRPPTHPRRRRSKETRAQAVAVRRRLQRRPTFRRQRSRRQRRVSTCGVAPWARLLRRRWRSCRLSMPRSGGCWRMWSGASSVPRRSITKRRRSAVGCALRSSTRSTRTFRRLTHRRCRSHRRRRRRHRRSSSSSSSSSRYLLRSDGASGARRALPPAASGLATVWSLCGEAAAAQPVWAAGARALAAARRRLRRPHISSRMLRFVRVAATCRTFFRRHRSAL